MLEVLKDHAVLIALIGAVGAVLVALIEKANSSSEEILVAAFKTVVAAIIGLALGVFIAVLVLAFLASSDTDQDPRPTPSGSGSSASPTSSPTAVPSSPEPEVALKAAAQRFFDEDYAPDVDEQSLADQSFVEEYFTDSFYWFSDKPTTAAKFVEGRKRIRCTDTKFEIQDATELDDGNVAVSAYTSRKSCGVARSLAYIVLVPTPEGLHAFKILSFGS